MKIEILSLSEQSLLTNPIETLIVRSPDEQGFESFKKFFAWNTSFIESDIQIFGENAELIYDELDEFMYQKSLSYVRTSFSSDSSIDEVTSGLLVSIAAVENIETKAYYVGLMGFNVTEFLTSLQDCGVVAIASASGDA